MSELQVRGNASPEEVAAMLAAVSARPAPAAQTRDPYARWRATRLAALRRPR